MEQVSGFFNAPTADDFKKVSNPELIYGPEDGFVELWRAGRGGRLRVYKALKPRFRGDPLYEGLLRKEFEIGYSLNHPNICEYLSFCNEEPFGNCIEMEWVDGDELGKIINDGACTDPCHILDQVCDALSYLHSRQVIHRDLKPSNILVAHNGGIVKLIDFGFADTSSHYALKQPAGTRAFAAPELLAGESVDCRADIWSLGCIIALMLPHRRRVVRKCMQRNPDRRYSSAAQVKAALHSGLLPVWVWVAIGMTLLSIVAVILPKTRLRPESPEITVVEDSVQLDDILVVEPTQLSEPESTAGSVQALPQPKVSAPVRELVPPVGQTDSIVQVASPPVSQPTAAPADSVPPASVEALFEAATRLIEDAGI